MSCLSGDSFQPEINLRSIHHILGWVVPVPTRQATRPLLGSLLKKRPEANCCPFHKVANPFIWAALNGRTHDEAKRKSARRCVPKGSNVSPPRPRQRPFPKRERPWFPVVRRFQPQASKVSTGLSKRFAWSLTSRMSSCCRASARQATCLLRHTGPRRETGVRVLNGLLLLKVCCKPGNLLIELTTKSGESNIQKNKKKHGEATKPLSIQSPPA